MTASITRYNSSSFPMCEYFYNIANLANGSNAISVTDFPPDGQWTPSHVWVFPNGNASGITAYADYGSINQTNGTVNFNLWVAGLPANTTDVAFDVAIF